MVFSGTSGSTLSGAQGPTWCNQTAKDDAVAWAAWVRQDQVRHLPRWFAASKSVFVVVDL